MIVGLRSFGVNIDTNCRIPSDTFIRLFGGVEKNAMRPNLKTKLFELVVMKDKESCLDFVRMFILFVRNCILFPKMTLYTPYLLFLYEDDLKHVRKLAWGAAVYRSLVDGIFKWKSVKTSLPPKRKKDKDVTAPKIPYVEGCAFALLVWVYEHLEGIILRPTGHVSISRMLRLHDKHAPSMPEATLAPSMPEATLELLSLVKTHEIVELYPSIDETEKLLRSTRAPQLQLHKESEDEDAERNEDE
ncbi:hypothetical protein Drorol1_Dr00021465 [Drosera rotundifolia]